MPRLPFIAVVEFLAILGDWPGKPPLSQSAIDALRKGSKPGKMVGKRYQIALRPTDAVALSACYRRFADSGELDLDAIRARRFHTAARIIDAAVAKAAPG